MSSVYKKGRDGYYYYQAYVLNPVSGKKDKKIYHSLGTKELKTAHKKQIEYDKKYSIQPRETGPNLFSKSTKLIILFLSLSALFILIFANHKKLNNQNAKALQLDRVAPNSDSEKGTSVIHAIEEKEPIQIQNKNNKKETIKIPKKIDFKIHRVERIPDLFNQGKLFITVKEKFDDTSFKKLCQDLRKEYKEFSNVIVSIYLESENGVLLAKGLGDNLSEVAKQKNWLVLYSYNKIEGVYYDNNPGGYLNQF